MESYLLRGILIGLLFGLPVGAVGTMTVQRTWNYGIRAGLLTGLGSSVADCLYACVGVFGLTFISAFLLRYQMLIQVLGGALILGMGIRLVGKASVIAVSEAPPLGVLPMFLSSLAIGITNPAAILTFLFAFSYFGIESGAGLLRGAGLVCGVFLGTYLWWGALSIGTRVIQRKTGTRGFRHSNQIFGAILTLFGAVVFMQALI